MNWETCRFWKTSFLRPEWVAMSEPLIAGTENLGKLDGIYRITLQALGHTGDGELDCVRDYAAVKLVVAEEGTREY